jgi:hypothetical protein
VLGGHAGVFAVRLLVELLRRPRPIYAFTLRTDRAHLDQWGTIVKNLEHLARLDRARFLSPKAAVDSVKAAKQTSTLNGHPDRTFARE